MDYAKALAPSDLLPKQYRGNPANVLVAIEYGAALGLEPMAAIQGIHVVEGKPTASAQLIGALVRKAGHRLRVQCDNGRAVATIIRADDPDFTFTAVWTLDRAQKAGLAGKGVWKQYPDQMLKNRAITEVARDACPEVLAGVSYTAEELGSDERPTSAPTPTVERLIPTATVAQVEEVVDTDTGEIIEEAVIVDDEPELQAEPPAEDAPEPDALDEFTRAESDAITKAQMGTLHAALKKLGIGNRDDGLQMIHDILADTTIQSTKQLTKQQASLVISTLTAMAARETQQ